MPSHGACLQEAKNDLGGAISNAVQWEKLGENKGIQCRRILVARISGR